MYIHISKALENLLAEFNISMDDVLSVMDEQKEGIIEALRARADIGERECFELERALSPKDLNRLLFVIQTFYILNITGIYKDFFLYPPRNWVMRGEKVSKEGLMTLIKALGMRTPSA